MRRLLRKILPEHFFGAYHYILALLGALLYRFPSRKIKVVGVTGTNGKTTTTEMINLILERAGYKTALVNSIRFKIAQEEEINKLKMTMPGRFRIQKFLRKGVNKKCHYAILEVTSEGIKQHRHRFIDFEAAIFTNLAPEHIESHGSFERYKEAKGELFRKTKNIHIVNLEDGYSSYFLKIPSRKKITFGLEKGDFNLKNTGLKLKVPGRFNLYNGLAAFSFALSQGVESELAKKALLDFSGVPGRMEEVISAPFKVFVDYAFTPNALEKVYQELKEDFQPNKMICVLGACGGGRDKWKRPVLGKIAREHCQEIIIANEDPYDENPMAIINQVAEGAGERAFKILDRREAIRKALELARPGDLVVVTGKGCEPWICLAKGKKVSWDDRRVVKEEFERLQGERVDKGNKDN